MIGNEAAAAALEREFSGKVFRFVDLEDVVPHLPSVSLIANVYTHCPNEIGLSIGQPSDGTGLDALRAAAGTNAGKTVDADMADQLWQVVKGRITSHMIGTYQARVQAKCNELG